MVAALKDFHTAQVHRPIQEDRTAQDLRPIQEDRTAQDLRPAQGAVFGALVGALLWLALIVIIVAI